MQFSRPFKSSSNSLPSPNGQYVATILDTKLNIRQIRSLGTIRVITLPPDFTVIHVFQWSPSSERIVVASGSKIRVYSSVDTKFICKISDPTSSTTRATSILFGATHDEVMVFSDFGLKLNIFNLITSKSVEISSPKFYTAGTASKGHSYRQGSGHTVLLTRCCGKDVVSLHAKISYEITRSFIIDTVDAQGICWSPDGRWIAVWESAAHGHKIMLYSADGHLYRTWSGPLILSEEDRDFDLGPGVKTLEWATSGNHIAVGTHSMNVSVLESPSLSSFVSLRHTNVIEPTTGLQIWQEQISHSLSGHYRRDYVLANQATCPPLPSTPPTNSDSSVSIGTAATYFDSSGTLLATLSEGMPTAVWIWDLASKILKAVLVQHTPIAKISWHPTTPELLMVRCEGEDCKALAYLWEPSLETPRILDFSSRLPEGKIIGRSIIRWLATNETQSPAIFFSDSQDCIMASLTDYASEEEMPWHDTEIQGIDTYGQLEESPLDLSGRNEKVSSGKAIIKSLLGEEMNFDIDDMDDTFDFRN